MSRNIFDLIEFGVVAPGKNCGAELGEFFTEVQHFQGCKPRYPVCIFKYDIISRIGQNKIKLIIFDPGEHAFECQGQDGEMVVRDTFAEIAGRRLPTLERILLSSKGKYSNTHFRLRANDIRMAKSCKDAQQAGSDNLSGWCTASRH